MIEFHFESEFVLEDTSEHSHWINRVIESEGFHLGELAYVFCNDAYLLKLNQDYLGHDTFTDIITFDYTYGKTVSGDVFISTERVFENAKMFGIEFREELLRVMCHGILHLMGYKDKTEEEEFLMRNKEDEKIKMFHVEQ
ncbi:MAG: rRNA maturation RNase YbeY [Allomuricauda sp.]